MTLRHILRRLVQVPMFTTIAAATLAIGIGANAAIFAVIDGVLLKPLPFTEPDRLVAVDHSSLGLGIKNTGAAPFLYFTYRDQARTFQGVGLWRSSTDTVTGLAEPEEVRSLDVTYDVLPVIGVALAVGRSFSSTDDSPSGAETVMLTHGYWQAKFGGDPSVIGRRLIVNSRPREIIGVLPAGFHFLDLKPSILLPLRLDRSQTHLGQFSYQAVARLKPGVTLAEANADVGRMLPIALNAFPPFPGYSIKMFEDARITPLVEPLKNAVIGDVGTVLWVLMGTVGVVWLIACANVANLMLVRVESRQHELAVRAALGAGRAQIARELLLEAVALGLAGGVLGLGLAYGAVRALAALAPANLPRLDQISIDATVALYTLALSIVAGLLFGLVPIIKNLGPQLTAALRAEGRTLSAGRDRFRARSTLVVVQVALALILLVSSGLLIRTFRAMTQVDPGFTRPEQLLTLRISIPTAAVKEGESVVRMEQAIADKIASLPGVSSVGLTSFLPMDGGGWHDPVFAEDRPLVGKAMPPLRRYRFVAPGLLQTMGNTLLAGRDLTWSDIYQKHPVAMVSDALARQMWDDPRAAIGKRIRESNAAPWREVVGVVSDERDDGVNQKAPAVVLWPILMDQFSGDELFVMRTLAYVIRSDRAGSRDLVNEISQAVWSVNPDLPLANVRTLQEIYAKSMARTSFTLVVLAIAGAMALLLGMAGLYGVIAYSVSQRTREIGIRLALGARAEEVRRMFVRYGARLTAIGVACGLIAAAALSRLISSLLFEVRAVDPLTYVAVTVGLLATAVLASYVPAWHATTVEPVEALRN